MAVGIKITLLFETPGSGWSETYWVQNSTTTTLKVMVDELVVNRIKVLGHSSWVVGARINRSTTPKDVEIYPMRIEGDATVAAGQTGNIRGSDQASVAVILPYKSSSGKRRNVTLSGVPDDWLTRDAVGGQFKFDGIGFQKLKQFQDYLTTGSWPLVVNAVVGPLTNPPKKVTEIGQNVDGRYLITTEAAHGLVAADKVTLRGVKGNNLALCRGVRKVMEKIDDNKFTIDRGPRADLGTVVYIPGGFAVKYVKDFEVVKATLEPLKITTRKRGRPFADRRGRRSVAK